jgi:hypothetical protein
MVREAARAPEEALESVGVLAGAAALVEAADLASVVVPVQDLAVELVVADLGQEAGRELELVAEAKHLESGSLHQHCFEAAVLAVVAPRLAEWAAGRALEGLGSAWRKKMSARCWGSSHSLGSLAKIPKRRWTFRPFSRA